jgi:hypothetical protein
MAVDISNWVNCGGPSCVNGRNVGKPPIFSGWWYTYPSEKYESVGMMTFPIYGKIKFMFQTTNQFKVSNNA